MKTHLKLVVAAMAVLAVIPTFAADEQDFLPAQTVIAAIPDGAPWSAEAPNGRTFKLTLNKDGTGSIRGPLFFSLSTKWEMKGDAMCLSNTMISKCLRFREIPGGFQGWEGDKPDLKFSR